MVRHFRLLLRLLILCAATASLGTGYAADQSVLSFQVEPIYDDALDEPALKKIAVTLEKRINAKKQVADVSAIEKNGLQIKFKGHEKDERERVQKLVETAGCLEFLITVNERDHGRIRELAEKAKDRFVRNDKKEIIARWVELDGQKLNLADEKRRRSGSLAIRTIDRGEVQALVLIGDIRMTGEHINHAEAIFDENGMPTVRIAMTKQGARRMEKLTDANRPEGDFHRRLGVVLNNRLIAAPDLRSVISSEALLAGRYTEQETEILAATLNAGHLPVPVRFKLVERTDRRQSK
jgi:preprotein translocase subunit SecD